MTVNHLAGLILGPSGQWRFVRIVVLTFSGAAVGRLIPLRIAAHQPGAHAPPAARRRQEAVRPRYAAWSAGALALVAGAAGCAYGLSHATHPAPSVSAARAARVGPLSPDSAGVAPATTAPGPYVGVFEPGATASSRLVSQFATATGHQPGISLYYSGWNDPFQIRFADQAHASHIIPFVQMLPYGVSMDGIAAGRYDSYLRSFAAEVRGYGYPVIIGFAPEMNGNWYQWGAGHTGPRAYTAAWRHVVDVFRTAGTRNVTWLWTINSVNAAPAPLRQWWPGSAYVTWVGIDGYYYRPTDTFDSVFGTSINEIRAFTGKRVLISETAVGPGHAQVSQINGLFAGVRSDHLAGFVWFDQAQHAGLYHQDWRLEGSPAALAAFRNGIRYLDP